MEIPAFLVPAHALQLRGETPTDATGATQTLVTIASDFRPARLVTASAARPPQSWLRLCTAVPVVFFLCAALEMPAAAQAPTINPGGIVNGANPTSSTVAPGSIAVVSGSFRLAAPSSATLVPLTLSLSGLSLEFNSTVQAPLFSVSETQVTLQVPWEMAGQSQVLLAATANGDTGAQEAVHVATYAPGIYSINGQGNGQGAILLNSSGAVADSSSTAVAGSDVVQIYCTGLGPVTNRPPTGSSAPLTGPLPATTTTPTVNIGGVPATVLFSGLAPGFVGLYQVDALVPSGATLGDDVPVSITIGGVESNTVTMAVQAPSGPGTLDIQITSLPAGVAANVQVSAASGYGATVTASEDLQVPAGTYSIQANTIPSGNLTYGAYAVQQSVTVNPGWTSTVQVAYTTVIPQTTAILDAQSAQGLSVAADQSTVSLPISSQSANTLVPGNVLAIGITPTTPNGLLRKVASVAQRGSQLVAATTQATLADAFQQAGFSYSGPITASNTEVVVNGRSAKVVHRLGAPRPRRTAASATADAAASCTGDTGIPIEMFNAQLTDDGSVTISGEIDVCPTLTFSLNTNALGLTSLTAAVTMTQSANATLAGEYSASFDDTVNYIPPILGDPIPVGPIVLTPILQFFAGADGTVGGSFSFGATETASITGGIQYQNGSWSAVVQPPTTTFTPNPLTLDANASAEAYAGVNIELNVDVVGTVQVSPQVFVQLTADTQSNPWWTLTGGITCPVSVSVGILGFDLADDQIADVCNYSIPMAQATSPFGLVPPTLTSPANGTSLPAGTTTESLQWSSVSGAVDYNVAVYTGSCGGTSFSGVTQSGTSYTVSGLSSGTTYYWRVQSVGAGGVTSAYSGCSTFSVASALTAPTLTSPANGTSLPAGTTSESLQWSSVNGAVDYNVAVYTGSCGGTSFSGVTQSGTSYTVSGLSNGQVYYWRVQSVGSGGATSAYSGCFDFSLAIPAPTLTSPANGTSLPAGTTTESLQWSSVSGAVDYNVAVYTGSCGGTSFSGVTQSGTSYTVSGLSSGTTYYWQVQSVGAGGVTSAYSGCSTFSVASALTAPTLTSPANGTSLPAGTTSESLQWSSVNGAVDYNVAVYTGSCGGTSFSGVTQSGTSYTVSGLSSGTTYYWRVQSVGAGGVTSPYSGCSNFSVATPSAPAVPTGLSPGAASPPGTTVTTLTPTLTWNVSPGATAYSVVVTQVGGGTVVSQNVTTNSVSCPTLQNGATYLWAVSASSSAGSSGASVVVYFTIEVPPPPPSLISPANATTFTQGTSSVTLQWSGSGASAYNVSVYTGSCGATPYDGESTLPSVTSFTVPTSNGGTYYWQVQSVGPGGTSASSCFTFAVLGISSVSTVYAESQPPISISGLGFGTMSPFSNSDSAYIMVTDNSQIPSWSAGHTGDLCNVSVSQWTNTSISLTANVNESGIFSICYLAAGDSLTISVWNPETGAGPFTKLVTVQ